ncbi:hypothetical protein B5X24_HaOG204028 [Helicoverpa armigera]|uniref:UPAR/Ly6 domain-containing protein n=1 Tax=Helicoverpa armigera TaxID=29058 RepID=A0A2W1BPB7_HELAM|nr:hypothetical protein B5X24_HaOG204028 [Helicoverpa armigera]
MCSMWFISIVALLVVDVRTGALQERDIRPARCHSCARVNGTACGGTWPSVLCPEDRPLCATVAISPDFVSSLECAAARETPCSMRSSANNSIEVTCVCNTHLCNAPFSPTLRNELLNFAFNLTNSSADAAQTFFQSFVGNITKENIYKAITIEVTEATTTIARNSSHLTTVKTVPGTMNAESILRDSEKPRAEPLKQEPTAPSDDDEDESEGSGAYEEPRVRNHAVSAPAAPSSFLPAENSATRIYTDTLLTTLFIYFVV